MMAECCTCGNEYSNLVSESCRHCDTRNYKFRRFGELMFQRIDDLNYFQTITFLKMMSANDDLGEMMDELKDIVESLPEWPLRGREE